MLKACIAAGLLLAAPAFAEVGDDGLHDAPYIRETFKDLSEDLAEAQGAGQSLIVMIEQRGCIYCAQMHERVFTEPDIARMLDEDYFFVQINMDGATEVTDFDGVTRTESGTVDAWGYRLTPTILIFPQAGTLDVPAPQAALAVIPGALDAEDTRSLLEWAQSDAASEGVSLSDYHATRTGQ